MKNPQIFDTLPIPNERIRKLIEFNHELFTTLLVTYLVLLLIEMIWPASVTAYLNLNYLLGIVIATGVATAIFNEEPNEEPKPKLEFSIENGNITLSKDLIFIAIFSIGGTGIIYYKTREIGKISIAISILGGFLIAMTSILILVEDEEEEG